MFCSLRKLNHITRSKWWLGGLICQGRMNLLWLIPPLKLIIALFKQTNQPTNQPVQPPLTNIMYCCLRSIWDRPNAWLTNDTRGLINSPVFLNAALMRDRSCLGVTNQETTLWIPSACPVLVAVTAQSPRCRQAVTGSTPAALVPVGTTLLTFSTGVFPRHFRAQPQVVGVWVPRVSQVCILTYQSLLEDLPQLNFHSFTLESQECRTEFCKVAWEHGNIKTQRNSLPSKYTITSSPKMTFFLSGNCIIYNCS